MEPWVTAGVSTIVAGLTTAITYLFKELRKVQDHHGKCEAEVSSLRERILSLEALAEQAHAFGVPAYEATLVVALESGRIKEWSPAATIMTHWLEREILDKELIKIIPERYRADHLAGVARMKAGKLPPERGPHERTILTKEGNEVKVSITYACWSVNGEHFMSATMRLQRS